MDDKLREGIKYLLRRCMESMEENNWAQAYSYLWSARYRLYLNDIRMEREPGEMPKVKWPNAE